MKPYLIVTFGLSVLLVAVHALRFALEGAHVARDPWFVGATAVAAGVAVWAWRLLRRPGSGT
jgi:hypothetical protein